jgi:DNA-binding MarR family transcriptional regulator
MKPDDVTSLLADAGIGEHAIDGVMRIDAQLQVWRRRMARRELGQKALKVLGAEIDLAQFDVLIAIDAPTNEFGETNGETMVNTIADRLAIDPSRASRLVAEMVEAGYAVRVASQADARRTLVQLTEAGRAIVDGVRAYKFLLIGSFLDNWKPKEIETFVTLLNRFSDWSERSDEREVSFKREIAALSRRIQRTSGRGQRTAGRAAREEVRRTERVR